MIENLEITNGVLNKKFNNNIYEYEVSVEENITTLIFNLQKDDNTEITIYGNDLLTCGTGHVYLETLLDNKVTTYTFLVNKTCSQNVISYRPSEDNGFVLNKNVRVPVIWSICIIVILCVYLMFFHKK